MRQISIQKSSVIALEHMCFFSKLIAKRRALKKCHFIFSEWVNLAFSGYWISLLINFDWKDNFLKLYSVHSCFSASGTCWNSFIFLIWNEIVLNWNVVKSFLKRHPQPPLNVLPNFLPFSKNTTLPDRIIFRLLKGQNNCW